MAYVVEDDPGIEPVLILISYFVPGPSNSDFPIDLPELDDIAEHSCTRTERETLRLPITLRAARVEREFACAPRWRIYGRGA